MTDMLQKTENVAKNVANENSQDLTEQWKKGELPSGWYYIKCDDEIFVDYYEEEIVDLETNETEKSWRNYFGIDEVLAQVPSYEEYAMTQDCVKRLFEAAEKETILKELLKECKEIFDECFSPSAKHGELYKKIDEVLK